MRVELAKRPNGKNSGLGNKKTRQNLFEETLSGEMPMTGLEPAPSCLE